MFGISQQMDKIKVDVQLELSNGVNMLGAFFIRRDQRISDLLNDERSFLPIEATNGLIINMNKTTIAQVTQLDQHQELSAGQDPYIVLGVPYSASDDEIRNTYHRRAQNYHPDRIQAAGLSAEFVDLANTQMARINESFERIMETRREEAQSGGSGAKDK